MDCFDGIFDRRLRERIEGVFPDAEDRLAGYGPDCDNPPDAGTGRGGGAVWQRTLDGRARGRPPHRIIKRRKMS